MMQLINARDFEGLLFFIAVRVAIILLCWLFMVLSSIVDFWSGTSTAKSIGQPIMSHGIRRTVQKIGDYVRLMLFALMFDILGTLLPFYAIPAATILCTIAVIFIEGKSVVENSRRKKAHASEIPEIVMQIVQATTTEQGHEILGKILQLLSIKEKDDRYTRKP